MLRIVFVLFVFAAMPAAGQLTIGAGGGLTRIGISGDAPLDGSWAARFGFSAALHAEYDLASDVSLTFQPGIQNRSSALEHTISTGTVIAPSDTTVDSLYVNTSYVSLPIGMRVYSASHRWFFATGAALHLLQKVEIDTLTGAYEPENVIQSFDASVYLGAGYRLPIDPFAVTFELRYQQGFVDLISDAQIDSFRDAAVIRMSGFSFGVAFEWRVLP